MFRLFQRAPSGPRILSGCLRDELVARFYVAVERAADLRCIEREGRYMGRPARYVRVFDPALLEAGIASVHQFYDVPTASVQFEGRVVIDGSFKLRDLRGSLLLSRAGC